MYVGSLWAPENRSDTLHFFVDQRSISVSPGPGHYMQMHSCSRLFLLSGLLLTLMVCWSPNILGW